MSFILHMCTTFEGPLLLGMILDEHSSSAAHCARPHAISLAQPAMARQYSAVAPSADGSVPYTNEAAVPWLDALDWSA